MDRLNGNAADWVLQSNSKGEEPSQISFAEEMVKPCAPTVTSAEGNAFPIGGHGNKFFISLKMDSGQLQGLSQ